MKYIKKIKPTHLICFAVLAMISSCSKNTDDISSSSTNSGSILSLIEKNSGVLTAKTDGIFFFQSNVANNDSSLKETVGIGGLFYDKSGNAINNGGAVSVGNLALSDSNGNFITEKTVSQNGLYGTDVSFTIKPPSGTPGNIVTATLYSPLPISITNIPPSTPLTLKQGASTEITWNTDPANLGGVAIMAEYIPSHSINRNIASAGAQKLVQNSQFLTDNGSYTISSSFFSGFPVGGHINLWIGRGNFIIASDGINNYTVGGYTASAIWDVVIEK